MDNPSKQTGLKTNKVGTISISGKGVGYVRIRDQETHKVIETIEVDPAFLNTALHGDTVKVELLSKIQNGAITGEVVGIEKRAKRGFAGVLEENHGMYRVSPRDQRMYEVILIPVTELNGSRPGDMVFATITEWKDPKGSPIGKVIKVLGKPRENAAEMEGIALEKGFDSGFPKAVDEEAIKIGQAGLKETDYIDRKDFRQAATFTIDPIDAKDFDDALSVESLPNGNYEIGIHIADVSHYVTPDSALDVEAYERATSVYLVDRVIPMLPEVLSNDLCSLKPDVDRLTMSAVFTLNKNGEVLSEWFGKTVIHSKKRFSYEEAQSVLDAGKGIYYEELNILNTLAKKLTKKRFADGALSLDQDEVRFKLDEKGVPISVYIKPRGDTNRLIEEFMLLANKKVAEFIAKKSLEKENIFVYRIHGLPDKERIGELHYFLKQLGYDLPLKDGRISPHELSKVIEELEGKPEQNTVQTAIIRSMAKAIYSTKNIGHYGLAFDYYTHFTSPIRRYPDVIVHRLLTLYLNGGTIKKEWWHRYDEISEHSSNREKDAQEAERASIKYKQVEYMISRIGKIFDGTVSGLTEWGMFVEEKESHCEGLIRLRDLGDDFFTYDPVKMLLTGQKKKQVFRIGDTVKVKVMNANLDKMVIDYALVK